MFQVAGCDIADLERWGASHSSHEVALEGEPQEAHRRLTESGQHSCSEAQLSGPSHRLQVDAPAQHHPPRQPGLDVGKTAHWSCLMHKAMMSQMTVQRQGLWAALLSDEELAEVDTAFRSR